MAIHRCAYEYAFAFFPENISKHVVYYEKSTAKQMCRWVSTFVYRQTIWAHKSGTQTEQRKCHFNGEATDFLPCDQKAVVCFRILRLPKECRLKNSWDIELIFSLSCLFCHILVFINFQGNFFFSTGNSNELSFNENWINYLLLKWFS